jgi:hypothetical protein
MPNRHCRAQPGNPSFFENAFVKMDGYAGLRRAKGLRSRRRVKPAYDGDVRCGYRLLSVIAE